MIVLAVRYRAKRGMGDKVAEALAEMIPLARRERGCDLYLVSRSQDDPDAFFIYEQYVDQAAADAHRETDHFESIIRGRIPPLLDERRAEVYALLGY